MIQKPHSTKHIKTAKKTYTKEGMEATRESGRVTVEVLRKHREEKKDIFILGYIKNFGNVSETCRKMNIGRKSFYRWMKDDEEFKQAIKDADEGFLDMAEGILRKKIKKGELIPTLFYLKTKGKTRGYIEAQKHMHMGEEEGDPIPIQFVRLGKKKKEKEKESKG